MNFPGLSHPLGSRKGEIAAQVHGGPTRPAKFKPVVLFGGIGAALSGLRSLDRLFVSSIRHSSLFSTGTQGKMQRHTH